MRQKRVATGAMDRLRKQLGPFGRQPSAEGGPAPLPDPRRKSMSVVEREWPSSATAFSEPVSPVGELKAAPTADGRSQTVVTRAQQIQSTFVVRQHGLPSACLYHRHGLSV